jgi:hypothetical protein
MAGFETRAIWGSDPGLVSDRFRYTGASVPPLDEEAIKRIQENAKQFSRAPLPSPSEVIAVQDIERLKAFEEAVKNPFVTNIPPLFSLNTNELNLQGTNPFRPGWQAAEQEWKRRGKWDAIQQGAIPPGRIGGIQPNPAETPSWLRALQNVRTPEGTGDYTWTDVNTNPNRPAPRKNPPTAFTNTKSGPFQDFLQNIRKAGSEVADVLVPGRHNVPQSMLQYIETPEFIAAKKEQHLFGVAPDVSIAPGELSEKQSRWLLDPRRTPEVGAGAFGAVTVPTNAGTAFKIQEKQTRPFVENELDKAIRTAELGLGPQVYSATLQPIENSDRIRSITRTEAIPHRKFEQLLPQEQRFLELERYKLTEDLYRGGISNLDNHFGNILLNDATRKAVQVDSGLARDYDPFNTNDLNSRLSNIVSGLVQSGMKDVAKDTSDIGLSLIDEIRTNPSPELYAEAENFFNRSGNLLMSQSKSLPDKPLISAPAMMRSAAASTLDIAGSVPLFDPGFRSAVERGDVGEAARRVGIEYAAGTALAPVVSTGVNALARTAPAAARAVTGALGVARTANPIAVVSQLGGDAPQPRAVGTYRGATVYRNPQGALVAAPIGGKPMRLGQATLGGKPTFVPWGSVAGTRVGPRKVGRPWWDVGQFFGR